MKTTRRILLLASGSVALAPAVLRAHAAMPLPRRQLTDRPTVAPGMLVLPPGTFIDDALIAALPSGAYEAVLSPANDLLLREVLRERRIDVLATTDVLRFELPAGSTN